MKVAIHYRSHKGDAESLAARFPGRGFAVGADLSGERGAVDLVREAAARLGGIDQLVHSAGIWNDGAIGSIEASRLEEIFRINVFSAFYLVREALPMLRRGAPGNVVLIGSTAGQRGEPRSPTAPTQPSSWPARRPPTWSGRTSASREGRSSWSRGGRSWPGRPDRSRNITARFAHPWAHGVTMPYMVGGRVQLLGSFPGREGEGVGLFLEHGHAPRVARIVYLPGVDVPAREGLWREVARAVDALHHPHIQAPLGLDEADGRLSMAVEHADGETLAEILAVGGRLPPEVADCAHAALFLASQASAHLVGQDICVSGGALL
ncbi:MAG: short-chain dehydrogenase/reductase, partial [Anaeromyxobacteraceae bacterium]|nr:short-chain dehydrogenase/reductase [Anaeromyxobacteraceae bacterium]